MEWYYVQGEQRLGPVNDSQMNELVVSGVVRGETMVWREGMETWQALSTVATVTSPQPTPANAMNVPTVSLSAPAPQAANVVPDDGMMKGCTDCGRTLFTREMVAYEGGWVCAACKEEFFQRLREGGHHPSEMRYAGFWIRFCARFIDNIIMRIPMFFVGMLVEVLEKSVAAVNGLPESLLLFVSLGNVAAAIGIAVGYEVFFLGKYGATPGKMAVNIKVVMSDGSPIGYGRAFGRIFGFLLSGIILYIGYIMAAFDEEKRSLHDRICDTRVVYKK